MMTNCAKPGFRMQGHEVTPLRAPLISSESEHAVSIVRLLAYAPPSLRHSSRAFSNSAISDTSVESGTGSSVSRASSYLRDTVQWTLVGAWRALSFRRATRDAFIARQTAFAMESTPPNSPIASAPLRGPAWPQVGITIANALVGAGCLGLPYALRNAGWAGLLIILGATLATCCTAKFLVQCIESLNARKVACSTYDDLVEFQFGSLGGVLMRVMTVAELYGGVVCMVTLQATNWPVLLGLPEQPLASLGLTQHIPRMLDDAHVLVTLLVCALAFPTLLVQTRHLAGFAAVGLCATATVAFVTLAAPLLNSDLPLADGASCPSLDASTRPADTMGRETLRLEGVGVATGLALFAFAGHATFPEMWRQMSASERPHFGKACDLGFGLAAVFYCTLAATGYFFFGNCAADTLTLNLMAASPALGGVATAGVLLSTFTSISVLSVPVARICREALAVGDKKAVELLRLREALASGVLQPFDCASLGIKLGLVCLAAVLSLSVPNFGFVVALIGAFTCMLISLILPTLCHVAVHYAQLSYAALLADGAIVVVGLVGMVIGVQSTLAGGA